jgi:5'-3' exonuclease
MGIPKLFMTINKNNITSNAIKENIKDNIEHKYFFIDYNSIIHTTSQKFINNLNESKKKVENIDDIIIDLCVEEINLLIKTFSKSKLDLLYIAIDGVPSMGKMIEQKKRRYMNTIINEYKKILKEKYKNELQKSFLPNKMNRYDYKEISFDKNKISPGTDFMKKLTKKLKSSKFNTKKYILSSFDEIGEGEKKILDYILQNNLNNCLIYSPDADMILLLCLLKNTNINILRHNQQTSTPEENIYDLINIDLFKQNLYSYIDFDLDKDKFIKDIVFLSSIFGNDFIPKIESIDVENNFQQLLDIYLDTYKSVNNYLVLFDKKYILNTNFFVDFLKKYLEFEQFNINEKYMNETYRFYRKFKNIYSLEYENVNHKNFDDINKQFNDKLDNFIKNPLNYINDNVFINQIKQIIQPNTIDTNLDNKRFVKKFSILKNNRIFKRYKWDKFTFTSNIPFHKNRINSMIKNGYNTNYDKELYIFINILDKYDKMFRKKVKYDITNDMIINYIEGILWTFNYYFNQTNNVSYWYYKYKESVFISDIYSYIYKNPNSLKDIYNNLKKYNVNDLNKYFTPDKQLEFISPKDKLIKKILSNLSNEINCKTKFINQCDIKSL